MIREILTAQDPVLRKKSKPVQKIDKKILSLIKDLKDTLFVQNDPEGIGLAAPQIGKNVQVFIIKPEDKMTAIINPKILSVKLGKGAKKVTKTMKKNKTMEGCLSLPHYYGPIKRPGEVRVKHLAENGQEKISTFRDLEAQIVLHEIDHLNGVLFVDRLLEQKKQLYELVGNEWHEVDLLL